jgi:hypothetical protein
MSEESTTPDLVELVRRGFEEASHEARAAAEQLAASVA